MPADLTSKLLLLFILIFGLITYLIIVNILKFIMSFHFISKLVRDFKKANKKYLESDAYKSWNPWKY